MEKTRLSFRAVALTMLPLLASAGPGAQGAASSPKAVEDPYEIPDAARERRNPVLRSDLALRNAQSLWQKHCYTCHGAKGRGDGPDARLHEQRKGHAPRNLTNPKVQENLTDGEIFWRISKGLLEDGSVIMPKYEQRIPSEMERWQLVLFVRELGLTARR